ncbi:MAG: hypothetical protein Q9226_006401 [Calogaya cf. arnoldii]
MESTQAFSKFLDLPNEILLNIIEHQVSHQEFENLTLTSKRVFELSKPVRGTHLHRKRKFSTYVVGDVHLYQSSRGWRIVPGKQNPGHTLRNLLSDLNSAADYCKILRIGVNDERGEAPGRYDDYILDQAVTTMRDLDPQLQVLIASQPYTELPGIHGLIDMQPEGLRTFSYIIALTSLHRIEALELTNCSESFLKEFKTVVEIMESSHSQLKRVELVRSRHRYDECLQVLAIFSQIPSVRIIRGLHVIGTIEYALQWPSRSSIEEIYFERSVVDGSSFEKLFYSTNTLKIFHYDYDSFLNFQTPPGYHPRRIISNLCSTAEKTLESLTLVNLSDFGTASGDEAAFNISLRRFLVLRHIAIDCSVFIDAKDTNDVSTLVDMLPATLETLELYNPAMDKYIPAMFRDLRDLREERLPRLRCISVQQGMTIHQETRSDCQELGIQMASVDAPMQKWPHLYS